MTPDERQMITGLFDRMRQQGPVEKDRDAEALIRDTVRQMPDAPYVMVQTVLVQEMALQHAQQQIQDLEDRVRSLEAHAARPQQSSGGSFLGGLFGSRQSSAPPPSVPAAGRHSSGFGNGSAPASGSPWGNAPVGRGAPMQGGMQQPGMMPMQQQAGGGGGFMRSAMATAAGVAGGMLAANAISNMMKGDSAQAASASRSDASNDAGGSYSASNDSGNDAGGSYDAGNDAGGSYDASNDAGGSYDNSQDDAGYDDGGSYSDE